MGPQGSGPLTPVGERRHVTVMFSDITGYSALTERFDPEEINEVLSRIRHAAVRIIERHGGIINQFVGDEVMAVFGIPNAHEDDAFSAVNAALELHAEIRERTGDVRARAGEVITLHTGINSGLIMAQYRNDREGLYQLTGEAVTTAASLRSLANADEILIGATTYRLVRPYFEMQACPPVTVKGKTVPVIPYRVMTASRIRSRFEAARERGLKRYVGRDRELETLRLAFARVLEGEGQLVTLEGEPGIGKSRLLYEFCRGMDAGQVSVTQGTCQSHAGDIAYFPFLDAVRRGFFLTESDSHADALETVVAGVRRIDPSLEGFLPHLLHLLSIPSDYALPADLQGEALRRALGEALVAMITLAARSKPLVLVIEDWHWSDPSSQSALRLLLRLVASYPLMIVVSYRSGYGFDFGEVGRRTSVRLDPLQEAEAEDFILAVTGATSAPPGLSAHLWHTVAGNPLFLEEACYALIEAGALSVVDDVLGLHQPLHQLRLPETVQAVIRSRLDRLDANAKDVVGHASVIGSAFNQQILARIYRGRASLEESLDVLQAQEIIRQTKLVPEPEYTFRHILTREVAYDTLLHQQRRQLHEAVGRAIEELYPERHDENAAILAHHYARSPRADRAVHYSLLAGHRAAGLYANAEAATYYEDALTAARALPPSPDTQRWQIDAIVGQATVATGTRNIERDCRNLEGACTFAEGLDDRRRLAQVLYWLGRNHYVLAELELAIKYARRSQEIADELGDAALAAPPVNLMGRAYWQLSDFTRSAQMMERHVEHMRVIGNASEEATAAGFVSGLLAYMGEFDKALAYWDRAITLARDLKNPFTEAASLHYRGIIHDQQGQWDAAIAEYVAARKIAGAAGDAFRVYLVTFMEGHAHHRLGDLARARTLIESSIQQATTLGTTFLLGQAKSMLAACTLSAGDVDADLVRALCAEAIGLAEKAGDKFTEALALRTLAETFVRSPDPADRARARQAIDDAIRMQEEIGVKPELGRTYVTLACVLKASGSVDEAARWHDRAIALFTELRMAWDVEEARRAFQAVAGGGT